MPAPWANADAVVSRQATQNTPLIVGRRLVGCFHSISKRVGLQPAYQRPSVNRSLQDGVVTQVSQPLRAMPVAGHLRHHGEPPA